MFAVIYQGYVKSGRESAYREAWNVVARFFVEKRRAIGSCLHRTSDGMWLAYSRWPDKRTWDASWPEKNNPAKELPDEIRKAILIIKDCLDERRQMPDIHMEVVDDLLMKK